MRRRPPAPASLRRQHRWAIRRLQIFAAIWMLLVVGIETSAILDHHRL